MKASVSIQSPFFNLVKKFFLFIFSLILKISNMTLYKLKSEVLL